MTLGHEGQFSSVLDPSPRGEGKGAQGMGEGGVIFGFGGHSQILLPSAVHLQERLTVSQSAS